MESRPENREKVQGGKCPWMMWLQAKVSSVLLEERLKSPCDFGTGSNSGNRGLESD